MNSSPDGLHDLLHIGALLDELARSITRGVGELALKSVRECLLNGQIQAEQRATEGGRHLEPLLGLGVHRRRTHGVLDRVVDLLVGHVDAVPLLEILDVGGICARVLKTALNCFRALLTLGGLLMVDRCAGAYWQSQCERC
ncbi:hypothetical protein NDR87_31250 [Nocardia sp. CDC159]|uniref:Uncharacterized protein n=1 Tax=Nocardia pulmonis TaxID=2951408 RepID=A0A9X2EBU2_9NOCA|nr:hypothetical protein [Nocardia pulmonis]MCM6790857.1 hypothetical protein [Nocardia sp. CDC159]